MKNNKINFQIMHNNPHQGVPMKGTLQRQNNSNLNVNKNSYKYTTAGNNNCGRINFKGVGSTLAKDGDFITRMAKKAAHSKFIQKTLVFVNKNELLTESLVAAVVTCSIRPLTILAVGGKNKDNKEKSKYAAGHSIASGLVGVAFAVLYSQQMKKGVSKAVDFMEANNKISLEALNIKLPKDKFTDIDLKDMAKHLNIEIKENKIISDINLATIKETAENSAILKKLTDFVRIKNKAAEQTFLNKVSDISIAPFRAMMTIALIPIILGLFGVKKHGNAAKNKEAEAAKQQLNSDLSQVAMKSKSEVFNKITGGIINASK